VLNPSGRKGRSDVLQVTGPVKGVESERENGKIEFSPG